jgi:two-component system, OmpR family, response regulator
MASSPHLLLLEDDPDISGMISRFMVEQGFEVSLAENAKAFERLLSEHRIDLVLLDLMLPGESGLSICRRLRATSTVPLIMITALGAETDRVVGLEVGADDYLTKPFSTRELLARVRAVLRRSHWNSMADRQSSVLTFNNWTLDLNTRKLLSPDGLRVPLTTGEFNILSVFCQKAGQVLSREQLLDLAHGRAPALFDRSIDLQVSRLRRKIEEDPKFPSMILTVRQGGYLFTPPVTSVPGVS